MAEAGESSAAGLDRNARMRRFLRHKKTEHAIAMTRGNPDRAQAIVRYGCAACHNIPGAQMPRGLAVVPLSGVADRL
jgi:hypothetical protein